MRTIARVALPDSFVGGIDFSNIFVTLKGPAVTTLADAQKAGTVTLNVGVFVNTVIQFLILGFAVFWLLILLGAVRNLVADHPSV